MCTLCTHVCKVRLLDESNLCFLPSDAEIVTPKTKEKAESRMWKTEQCLHEAVALSLKGEIGVKY